MDFGTLIGVFAGLTLIIWSMAMGSDLITFVDVPSAMLVFGGTIAATLITFPLVDVNSAFKAAWGVLKIPSRDMNDLIRQLIKLSNLARRQGLVSLGGVKTSNRFLLKAAQLISDGASEDLIRNTLRIEIETLKARHSIGQDVFRKMANYAPAFGMLGTVIGLIQMLQKLSDPGSVGPAMVLALITTFYGSLLSSLIFLPIAGKLKARTEQEVLALEIIFEGAACILDNSNPMIVYEKLSAFIAPHLRKPMSMSLLREK